MMVQAELLLFVIFVLNSLNQKLVIYLANSKIPLKGILLLMDWLCNMFGTFDWEEINKNVDLLSFENV